MILLEVDQHVGEACLEQRIIDLNEKLLQASNGVANLLHTRMLECEVANEAVNVASIVAGESHHTRLRCLGVVLLHSLCWNRMRDVVGQDEGLLLLHPIIQPKFLIVDFRERYFILLGCLWNDVDVHASHLDVHLHQYVESRHELSVQRSGDFYCDFLGVDKVETLVQF